MGGSRAVRWHPLWPGTAPVLCAAHPPLVLAAGVPARLHRLLLAHAFQRGPGLPLGPSLKLRAGLQGGGGGVLLFGGRQPGEASSGCPGQQPQLLLHARCRGRGCTLARQNTRQWRSHQTCARLHGPGLRRGAIALGGLLEEAVVLELHAGAAVGGRAVADQPHRLGEPALQLCLGHGGGRRAGGLDTRVAAACVGRRRQAAAAARSGRAPNGARRLHVDVAPTSRHLAAQADGRGLPAARSKCAVLARGSWDNSTNRDWLRDACRGLATTAGSRSGLSSPATPRSAGGGSRRLLDPFISRPPRPPLPPQGLAAHAQRLPVSHGLPAGAPERADARAGRHGRRHRHAARRPPAAALPGAPRHLLAAVGAGARRG